MDQQFIYFYDLEQKYPDFADDLNLLERSFYEMEIRRTISKFIITNSILKEQCFLKYWKDYLNHIKSYFLIRNAFKEKYLSNFKNVYKNFKLDFMTRRIYIEEGDSKCLQK